MRRRGGGSIVMIASIWGRESGGRMTYNAVKAAEISLAKSLAQQLARDNIRVNSIAPGSILFPGGSWHRRQQEDPGDEPRRRLEKACSELPQRLLERRPPTLHRHCGHGPIMGRTGWGIAVSARALY